MTISPSVLDAMLAAGCTAEQIVAAVKADAQEVDARATRKRDVDAARKRRQRERDRESHAESRGHLVTDGDGADTVSPKKESPPAPPKEKTTPSSTEPSGSSKTRAARLPADWTLPVEWQADAIKAGLPANRIDLEAEKMRDWSLSSPNGAKRDWRAAWRNWVKGAADKLPKARGSPPRQSQPRGSDFFDMEAERLRNERTGSGGGYQGDWDDAAGVPVLTIDYHG